MWNTHCESHWFQFLAIYANYANNQCGPPLLFVVRYIFICWRILFTLQDINSQTLLSNSDEQNSPPQPSRCRRCLHVTPLGLLSFLRVCYICSTFSVLYTTKHSMPVCLSVSGGSSFRPPSCGVHPCVVGWIQPNIGESARGFPRNQLIRECAAENAAWVLLLLEHFLLFFTARVLCISTTPGEKSVINLAFAAIRSHVFRPFLSPNSLLFLCRVMSLARTGVFAFLF